MSNLTKIHLKPHRERSEGREKGLEAGHLGKEDHDRQIHGCQTI